MGQIDPRTLQTYNNIFMYISQHISVLKLCMHVHDPKQEKVKKNFKKNNMRREPCRSIRKALFTDMVIHRQGRPSANRYL